MGKEGEFIGKTGLATHEIAGWAMGMWGNIILNKPVMFPLKKKTTM